MIRTLAVSFYCASCEAALVLTHPSARLFIVVVSGTPRLMCAECVAEYQTMQDGMRELNEEAG